MQLKAIVTSVCTCVCVCVRVVATVRLGINVPALEQTDRSPDSLDFNNNFISTESFLFLLFFFFSFFFRPRSK